ncbi:MAG: hypothetical protein ABIY55_25400 [Kofleriaceae bacterium]
MTRGRPRLVGPPVAAGGVAALVIMLAACGRAPIATCGDDLRGVYASGAERWMVLDDGATIEAYPLFADGGGDPTLEVAPRVIELARTPGAPAIAGTLRRRYMQQAARCDARVPVHVTRCAGTTLELVFADPSPPTSFAPCTWPRPAASRVARWQRE